MKIISLPENKANACTKDVQSILYKLAKEALDDNLQIAVCNIKGSAFRKKMRHFFSIPLSAILKLHLQELLTDIIGSYFHIVIYPTDLKFTIFPVYYH